MNSKKKTEKKEIGKNTINNYTGEQIKKNDDQWEEINLDTLKKGKNEKLIRYQKTKNMELRLIYDVSMEDYVVTITHRSETRKIFNRSRGENNLIQDPTFQQINTLEQDKKIEALRKFSYLILEKKPTIKDNIDGEVDYQIKVKIKGLKGGKPAQEDLEPSEKFQVNNEEWNSGVHCCGNSCGKEDGIQTKIDDFSELKRKIPITYCDDSNDVKFGKNYEKRLNTHQSYPINSIPNKPLKALNKTSKPFINYNSNHETINSINNPNNFKRVLKAKKEFSTGNTENEEINFLLKNNKISDINYIMENNKNKISNGLIPLNNKNNTLNELNNWLMIINPNTEIELTKRIKETNQNSKEDILKHKKEKLVLIEINNTDRVLKFPIRESQIFEEIFKIYCYHNNLDFESTRFLYDGERILNDSTPKKMGIELRMEIDIGREQIGGGPMVNQDVQIKGNNDKDNKEVQTGRQENSNYNQKKKENAYVVKELKNSNNNEQEGGDQGDDDDDPDEPGESSSYESAQKDDKRPSCCICTQGWYHLNNPGYVDCPGRHQFCQECLREWVMQQNREGKPSTCPICRQYINNFVQLEGIIYTDKKTRKIRDNERKREKKLEENKEQIGETKEKSTERDIYMELMQAGIYESYMTYSEIKKDQEEQITMNYNQVETESILREKFKQHKQTYMEGENQFPNDYNYMDDLQLIQGGQFPNQFEQIYMGGYHYFNNSQANFMQNNLQQQGDYYQPINYLQNENYTNMSNYQQQNYQQNENMQYNTPRNPGKHEMIIDYQRGDLEGNFKLNHNGPNEDNIRKQINDAICNEQKKRENDMDILREEMSKNMDTILSTRYHQQKIELMKIIGAEKKSNAQTQSDQNKKLKELEEKYSFLNQKSNEDENKGNKNGGKNKDNEDDKKKKDKEDEIVKVKRKQEIGVRSECCSSVDSWCKNKFDMMDKEKNLLAKTIENLCGHNQVADAKLGKFDEEIDRIKRNEEELKDSIRVVEKIKEEEQQEFSELNNRVEDLRTEVSRFRELTQIQANKVNNLKQAMQHKIREIEENKENNRDKKGNQEIQENSNKKIKETMGFKNKNNSCFINSALQGFFCMDGVVDKIKDVEFENEGLKEFKDLIGKMTSKDKNASLDKQVKILDKKGYKSGEQDDAAIQMTNFISNQEQEYRKSQKDGSKENHAKNIKEILDLFSGETNIKRTCKDCKEESGTDVPFQMLRIEQIEEQEFKQKKTIKDLLQGDKALNVQESMIKFYGDRDTKKAEAQECGRCNEKKLYWEKEVITKWPKNLLIHPIVWEIKMIDNEKIAVKKPIKIDYGNGRLSLGGNISLNNEKVEYEQCGIICHKGVAHGGHYYTLMEKEKGSWIKINDDDIKTIKTGKIQMNGKEIYLPPKDPNAYFMIYRKLERNDNKEINNDIKEVKKEEIIREQDNPEDKKREEQINKESKQNNKEINKPEDKKREEKISRDSKQNYKEKKDEELSCEKCCCGRKKKKEVKEKEVFTRTFGKTKDEDKEIVGYIEDINPEEDYKSYGSLDSGEPVDQFIEDRERKEREYKRGKEDQENSYDLRDPYPRMGKNECQGKKEAQRYLNRQARERDEIWEISRSDWDNDEILKDQERPKRKKETNQEVEDRYDRFMVKMQEANLNVMRNLVVDNQKNMNDLIVNLRNGDIERETRQNERIPRKQIEGSRDFKDNEKGYRRSGDNMEENKIPSPVCHTCNEKGHLQRDCPKVKCMTCGNKGHIQRNCPELKCHNCGRLGHMERECPEIICLYCGEKGHIKRNCLKLKENNGNDGGIYTTDYTRFQNPIQRENPINKGKQGGNYTNGISRNQTQIRGGNTNNYQQNGMRGDQGYANRFGYKGEIEINNGRGQFMRNPKTLQQNQNNGNNFFRGGLDPCKICKKTNHNEWECYFRKVGGNRNMANGRK